jgi:hypothetical protein
MLLCGGGGEEADSKLRLNGTGLGREEVEGVEGRNEGVSTVVVCVEAEEALTELNCAS